MSVVVLRLVVLLVVSSAAAPSQLFGDETRPVVATEPSRWRAGLTDRELALARWFSQLTFLQDRSAKPWPTWHDDGKQLGTSSLRYQLAFAGYGCAAQAAQTPAYRELIQQQLRDLCERMLDVRVWSYVTHYWQYGANPPDPCLYENVIYTGHLTQLMCLYELLTGDTRYSEAGWDFVWRDGRRVHYHLRQAIERLHVQSERSVHGGICCEPDLVFATCNSHSAASFLLFDLLHDYPNVYVRTAEYRAPVLRFTVLKGRPGFRGTTELVCQRIPPRATVSRDGKRVPDFQQTGSTLRIRTDVETEHVFEVAPASD